MKKIIVLFISLVLFQSTANAACVGQKCTMNKIFDSWKGESLDELISAWGYPDSQKTIAGHDLYFWKQGTYKVKIGDSTKTVEYCTRIIEVDKSKNVVAGKYKGENCPATSLTAKKWIKKTDDNTSVDE